MHTHEVVITNLRWNNLMLMILCISNDNLMIIWTFLSVALSWRLWWSCLQVCWSCKELRDAQFVITPKIVRPATYQTWILPSSRWLGSFHLTIHVKYVRRQTMLIKCYVVIIVMVDIIYFASSRSSFKIPSTFGTVHHVLLHHLHLYSDHAMFFLLRLGGDIWKFHFSLLLCIVYICVCIFFWLINFYLRFFDWF